MASLCQWLCSQQEAQQPADREQRRNLVPLCCPRWDAASTAMRECSICNSSAAVEILNTQHDTTTAALCVCTCTGTSTSCVSSRTAGLCAACVAAAQSSRASLSGTTVTAVTQARASTCQSFSSRCMRWLWTLTCRKLECRGCTYNSSSSTISRLVDGSEGEVGNPAVAGWEVVLLALG